MDSIPEHKQQQHKFRCESGKAGQRIVFASGIPITAELASDRNVKIRYDGTGKRPCAKKIALKREGDSVLPLLEADQILEVVGSWCGKLLKSFLMHPLARRSPLVRFLTSYFEQNWAVSKFAADVKKGRTHPSVWVEEKTKDSIFRDRVRFALCANSRKEKSSPKL